MLKAGNTIVRWITKKLYRKSFKEKGIIYANLYFESPNTAIKPTSKVEVFGEFGSKPWQEKVICVYDPKARCFKSGKCRIKIGSQFKFLVDGGRIYLTSSRYAT